MRTFTHVFAEPGERCCIDVVNPETGRSAVYGETLEEVRKRYPRAEMVAFNDWAAAHAVEQDAPVTWSETTAEKYNEMLGVLPPVNRTGRGFQVGEPMDHHTVSGQPRYTSYRCEDGKYLVASRPMTSAEFLQALSEPS